MDDSHVLVIEDEIKMARLLADYLADAGFKVTCLYSGGQVIDKIKSLEPSMILLDIVLPGIDGISLFREIRKLSDIPVIMVTGKVEEVDRLIGLEIGADDYICKPFSPREVVARVKAVLRRTRNTDAPRRLVAGRLILDEGTCEVTIDGLPVDITPCEYRLLNVLMEYPGRVFSRLDLLNKIQGYSFEGYDRTIDSHVKNLRRKIAARLPDQEIVATVYGMGYKLSIN